MGHFLLVPQYTKYPRLNLAIANNNLSYLYVLRLQVTKKSNTTINYDRNMKYSVGVYGVLT